MSYYLGNLQGDCRVGPARRGAITPSTTMSRVLPELGERDRASAATWEDDIAPKLKSVQTPDDRR